MSKTPNQERYGRENYELARDHHSHHRQTIEREREQLINIATFMIRAPGIAGAAGIAALLGFITGNIEKASSQITTVTVGLTCFAATVFLTVLLYGLTYLIQIFIIKQSYTYILNFHPPWVHPAEDDTDKYYSIAACLWWIACCMLILSYLTLLSGMAALTVIAINSL